jgi:hypothetical protein
MEMVIMAKKELTKFTVILSNDYSKPGEVTAWVFMGSKKENESKLLGEN